MIASLKAEYQKLLTVRSTYIITSLVLLFVGFIAFYPQGLKLSPAELLDPNHLDKEILTLINLTLIGAVVAILLMTHEYRYNTITLTLTSSRSRSLMLLSKIIVISTYSVVLAVMMGVLVPLLSIAGVHAHGLSFVAHQNISLWNLVWRVLYYSWGYGMTGLLIATLVRSQVAAISILFVTPSVVEPLLGLVLHQKAEYLPFTVLGDVTGTGGQMMGPAMSALKAMVYFTIYLVIGWAVAWYLFLERDAT